MRGLLEKDLRLTIQKKQTIVVFVVVALILGISGSGTFAVVYFTLLAGIMASGTLSYDEFDNGLEFLMTLPIDRKTYVREKFLFSTAASAAAWCISLVLFLVSEIARGGKVEVLEKLPVLFIVLPTMATFATIILPLQLKFGTEKGRVFLYVLFGGLALLFATVKNLFLPSSEGAMTVINNLQGMPMWSVMIVIIAFCVLVEFISYICSVRIMQNKEL